MLSYTISTLFAPTRSLMLHRSTAAAHVSDVASMTISQFGFAPSTSDDDGGAASLGMNGADATGAPSATRNAWL